MTRDFMEDQANRGAPCQCLHAPYFVPGLTQKQTSPHQSISQIIFGALPFHADTKSAHMRIYYLQLEMKSSGARVVVQP